jgi:hypothetical protein
MECANTPPGHGETPCLERRTTISKDIKIPPWAKWAGGVTLLAIALTSGTLGLVLNVAHGLEAGLAAGIAFGLADLAKITIPLVAGLIGWSRQMRITAAICVAVSLWSAVNVYLDGAGAAILAKQHASEAYTDKAKAIAELETEATRLSDLAAQEAKNRGCGPNCRGLNEQASAARQRLQEARNAKAEAKPVEISGLAAIIAMASGAGQDGIARGIGAIKALLFLVLIEVLVWLSVPAMALLSDARRREVAVELVAIEPVEIAKPVAKPVMAIAKPAASGTAAYYLARLERDHPAIAKRVHGGELSVYRGSVEAGIRKPAAAKKWTTIEDYLPETVKA